MKMLTKKPGLTTALAQSELDLSYKSRFEDLESPDGAFDAACFLSHKALRPHPRADISRPSSFSAYERLIFDVIKGDHNLFVRDDELEAAWKIFTPILHQLEKEKVAFLPLLFFLSFIRPRTDVTFRFVSFFFFDVE